MLGASESCVSVVRDSYSLIPPTEVGTQDASAVSAGLSLSKVDGHWGIAWLILSVCGKRLEIATTVVGIGTRKVVATRPRLPLVTSRIKDNRHPLGTLGPLGPRCTVHLWMADTLAGGDGRVGNGGPGTPQGGEGRGSPTAYCSRVRISSGGSRGRSPSSALQGSRGAWPRKVASGSSTTAGNADRAVLYDFRRFPAGICASGNLPGPACGQGFRDCREYPIGLPCAMHTVAETPTFSRQADKLFNET